MVFRVPWAARHHGSVDIMKFEAVIFDLFGTLVDGFVSSGSQTTADLATTLGAPYEPFMQVWRQTLDMRSDGTFQSVEAALAHGCESIGIEVGREQMAKAVAMRLRQITSALNPRPYAVETLEHLKGKSYKTGLLSNCSIEIPILWPETPFATLFNAAIFSCRECLKKPDPRIYQLVCERLGVAAEKCLYVADGENFELAAAAQVGLHPVLIQNPARDNAKEILREAREWQGKTITTLSEVLEIVEQE